MIPVPTVLLEQPVRSTTCMSSQRQRSLRSMVNSSREHGRSRCRMSPRRINTWCLIPTLVSPTVNVSPKVFLEGPYVSGLMSDTLRFSGLLPLTEPYTALGYPHAGGGGGEITTSGVLAVTGSNAIVDWVVVELRNSANSSQVLASRCALLQRDGDIVAMN